MSSAELAKPSQGLSGKILRFLPGQAIPPVVGFLAIPFLTKFLSEAEYGRYILILTTVAVMNVFVFAWIPNCALRFYRPMREQHGTYVFHLFLSMAIMIGLVALGVAAGWPLLPEKYRQLLYLSIPLGILAGGNSIVNSLFRAADQSMRYSLMLGLGALCRYLPGLLCLFWIGAELEYFAMAWLVAFSALFVFELLLSGMWRHAFWGRPSHAVLAKYATYGLPLMLAGLCTAVMGSANRYLLAGFHGDVEVGMFGVCSQMATMPLQLISRSITVVLLPAAVDSYHDDPVRLCNLLSRAVQYTILLILPVAAVGAGGGRWFLASFTKTSYVQAAPALGVLLLASLLLALTHVYRVVFMVFQQTPAIARIAMIGAVVSLIVNLLLIPRLGFMGAAWTYLITQVLLLALTIWSSRPLLRFAFAWKTLGVTMAGSGMLFVLLDRLTSDV